MIKYNLGDLGDFQLNKYDKLIAIVLKTSDQTINCAISLLS